MIDHQGIYLFELTLGVLIVAAIFLRVWLENIGVPSLVGFIVLGFLVRVLDGVFPFISEVSVNILEFLASTGIFILMFRIGLDSNLHGLVGKLPRALPIWLGNVTISGLPAYFVCHWMLGLGVVPSLFTAVALTATSVAVTTELWREAGALNTPDGETLVDVAELDDLSGIAFMALAIAVAPALHAEDGETLTARLSETSLMLIVKAAALVALCMAVAWLSEKRLTALLRRVREPHAVLIIMGVGLTVAAIASLLGFSIAIGAFFAGIIFSRNPMVVRLESGFLPLHAFFVPFFFIAIGFHINPALLLPALQLGGVLLIIAIFGKIVGTALPALLTTSGAGAILIGVSMVPRAEIAMVIGQQAQSLGDWAMPDELYSGIALVSLLTSVITPFAVHALLKRRRPTTSPGG